MQPLLDAVIDYLPSPLDVSEVAGVDPASGEEMHRKAKDDEPFSALAFKIMSDPFSGQLTYFRVYSGKLEAGSYVYNVTQDKRERIGRLLKMHANKREDINVVYSGDIAAAVGMKGARTGDTLAEEKAPILLEVITFPDPVISMAVEPKTKQILKKWVMPSISCLKKTLHFICEPMKKRGRQLFPGWVNCIWKSSSIGCFENLRCKQMWGKPEVAYRETIRKKADAEGKYIKQSGGRGQYGHCVLSVEPAESGVGLDFVNKIVGGIIPREYIPAIEKGVKERMESGVLAGFPLRDVRVTLYDGSFHDVDSNEMAFKIAGSMAFEAGVRKLTRLYWNPS